jgi:hypothetical protein
MKRNTSCVGLEGTKDADLRVVADTGSTDKTVALLQAAPNVIVHQISMLNLSGLMMPGMQL